MYRMLKGKFCHLSLKVLLNHVKVVNTSVVICVVLKLFHTSELTVSF